MGVSGLKILVVDDEEFLRSILVDLLVELGHSVIQASDGSEALKIYMEHKDEIDLVILDVIMPSMSGVEVLREIKKLNEDVKIILTSGFLPEKEMESLSATEKNVKYIPKPYRLGEIERAIKNLFEQS